MQTLAPTFATTLAVVPIFITAGSAVLPTLLAAIAGAAAVLLRPRELVGMIRRHRAWAATFVAAVVILASGLYAFTNSKPRGVARVEASIDWAAVARQIIERERATTVAAVGSPTSLPSAAVVEGRDFTRCSSDGGRAPTGLRPLWTYAPDDTMFLATPAVAGDRVFVAGCVSDLGGFTGRLACLDAATGRVIWDITEAAGEPLKALFSSPAVTADGQSVVVGEGFHADRDCVLRCFDAATGRLRWAVKSTEHIESSPAIVGDVAVVGVGAIEDKAGRATGDAGYVMAVRISDGRLLWKQRVIDAESSPAISADGTVYTGSGLNGLAVVAITPPTETASNGASERDGILADRVAPSQPVLRWRTEVNASVTNAMTLAGDLVVAGSGNGDFVHSDAHPEGSVIALDRATGAVRWRTKLDDAVVGPVAFADGRLYAPIRSGKIAAIDVVDARVLWTSTVSGASPVLAGCAVAADAIYALAADGTLAVLDRATGRVLEKHALNDPARGDSGLSSAAPQIAGGRLILGTESGGIRCLVGTKAAQ